MPLPSLPLQALYERACEYLDLSTRIDVVNARFEVGAWLPGWACGMSALCCNMSSTRKPEILKIS